MGAEEQGMLCREKTGTVAMLLHPPPCPTASEPHWSRGYHTLTLVPKRPLASALKLNDIHLYSQDI